MQTAKAEARLYVAGDLVADASLRLDKGQAHYLGHVLRLRIGDRVALFNGRDGEWRGRIEEQGRGRCILTIEAMLRPQAPEPDLWLVFAPIKRARIDFLAAKATELGVSALWPVFTKQTVVRRVNSARLRANAAEAAEQCGRLSVPEIFEPQALEQVLTTWPADRPLLVCDETGGGQPIAGALARHAASQGAAAPAAILTGPEGGFAQSELDALRNLPFVTAVSLGPRVLMADTAALAALALWQALSGDWRQTSSARHE